MTQLLSVASGLIAVYVLLALIVSHVGEWFSSLVNQRGKLLERAIVALVAGRDAAAATNDPKPAVVALAAAAGADVRDPRAIVQYLYAHPLIGNLGADRRLPSYIPSRTFSLSLVAGIEAFTAKHPPPAAVAPFTTGAADWNTLRTNVAALPDGTLRQSLTTLLDEAQTDYSSALAAIDAWFDLQMDRIAGTYKRWATKIMIVIALVTAVVLNADTIGIANQLLRSSTIASALANSAQTAPGQDISGLVGDLSQANLTIGWSPAPPNPLHGWTAESKGELAFWFAKLGGLLLTTFALLLGAPFWFDVLKQIVPLRMSGAKPVRAASAVKGDVQAKAESPPP